MGTYRIRGADRDSGADVVRYVRASSIDEAEEIAQAEGVLISSVSATDTEHAVREEPTRSEKGAAGSPHADKDKAKAIEQRMQIGCAAVVGVMFLLVITMCDWSGGAAVARPASGGEGYLRSIDGQGRAFVSDSEHAMSEWIEAARVGDNHGANALVAAGSVFPIERNTRCLVLSSGAIMEVRVLESEYAGQTLYASRFHVYKYATDAAR